MTNKIEAVDYKQKVKPVLLGALRDIEVFKTLVEAIEQEIIGHMSTEDVLSDSAAYEIKLNLFRLTLKSVELKEIMQPAMNQLALYIDYELAKRNNYKLARRLVD